MVVFGRFFCISPLFYVTLHCQREGKARRRARQAKPLMRQPNTRNYQLYKGTLSAV
jgi:hypothetical protein